MVIMESEWIKADVADSLVGVLFRVPPGFFSFNLSHLIERISEATSRHLNTCVVL